VTPSMTSPTPTSDLTDLLTGAGVPATFGPATAAHLGERAADRLRADPWELLLVPAVRPEQADHFARQVLGGAARPDDPRRGRALVVHLLAAAGRQGHTALPLRTVAERLAALRVADPSRAVADALDEARVLAVTAEDESYDVDEESEPEQLLALARYAMAEDAVAEGLMRLAATVAPAPEGVPFEPGVTVLSGPGCVETALTGAARSAAAGLRTIVATITTRRATDLAAQADVTADLTPEAPPTPTTETSSTPSHEAVSTPRVYEADLATTEAQAGRTTAQDEAGSTTAEYEAGRVTAEAEVGRAAGEREAGGAGGGRAAGVRVMALGRLLEAVPVAGGVAFGRGEQRPVEADLVVVPDAGVLDVELAAALVEACPDGSRLVLAGDPAELPSAGAGRVFGDVVAAGVLPVARTQTAGPEYETPIEQLLGAVREGELAPVDAPGKEVVIVPAAGPAQAVHRAVQLVTDSIPRALGIPAAEVQVVAPASGGEAGCTALNVALKERLNPGPGKYRGFDPGDRVVVVAPLAGVQVGETGTVLGVAGAELEVEFPQGVVRVGVELVPRLRPGWAITVPQALGTRWRAVVAVLTTETPLTRPLVASAIARAAEHLSIVHAAGPELARAVEEVPGAARHTRLTGLLRTM